MSALEKYAARVVGDQVVLRHDVVARLEQQSDRREAAVPDQERLRRNAMRLEYMMTAAAAPFSNRLSSNTLSSENM